MSQTNNDNSKVNNYYNKQKFKMGRDMGKYYYNRFNYYDNRYSFQAPYYFRRKKPPFKKRHRSEIEPQRPTSPFSGTEEYTLRKIQETSDMIKKQLMNPPQPDDINAGKTEPVIEINRITTEMSNEKKNKCENGKAIMKSSKKAQYNVEEIHQKIVTHITNLNYGKKVNLICATSSGYDIAIQQIQKQKRLELSRVLREMCSNQTVENSDAINSIIPDIGIKIEDLPLEVIQELSSTLDLNFEDEYFQSGNSTVEAEPEVSSNLDYQFQDDSLQNGNVTVKTEVCDNDDFVSNIKVENASDEITDFTENPSNGFDASNCDINLPQNVFSQPTTSTDSNMDSVSSQTDCVSTESNATQTDFPINGNQFDGVEDRIENLEDAVKSMLEIDEEIARLTKLRQSIFLKLQTKSAEQKELEENTVKRKKTCTKKVKKKVKLTLNKSSEVDKPPKAAGYRFKKEVHFGITSEKILVVKVVQDTILAGSETGRVFFIRPKTGNLLHTIQMGQLPITSLCYWKGGKSHLFVGSFETHIRDYNFNTRGLIKITEVGDSVQCMELSWDHLFIGTVSGSLLRYSVKKTKIEFEDRISRDSVLVLKATQEGARRVLLVGTRNLPVCIRDAMSGLHMRTMNELVSPTVYALLLENSLVYCGTPLHNILVFNFNDGNLIHKHNAANSKGIGCMKIVENLLFASCHNGNIYVYTAKTHKYVGVIQGPGGVILSMEILENIIIVGTMSFNFKSILIPEYILETNRSEFRL